MRNVKERRLAEKEMFPRISKSTLLQRYFQSHDMIYIYIYIYIYTCTNIYIYIYMMYHISDIGATAANYAGWAAHWNHRCFAGSWLDIVPRCFLVAGLALLLTSTLLLLYGILCSASPLLLLLSG